MAFAVTKFVAYGLEIPDTVRKRTVQRVAMDVTAAATDNTWDIGTLGGTFWTSALAHATYGQIATTALAKLTYIGANCKVFVYIGGDIATNYNKLATAANNDSFTMSISNGLPVIGFKASQAPTAVTLVLEWSMNDGIVETVADIG